MRSVFAILGRLMNEICYQSGYGMGWPRCYKAIYVCVRGFIVVVYTVSEHSDAHLMDSCKSKRWIYKEYKPQGAYTTYGQDEEEA